MNTFPPDVIAEAKQAADGWVQALDSGDECELFEAIALAIVQDRAARIASVVGLTPRQRDALTFIGGYFAINGYAPGLEEIAAGLGIRSKSSAHRLVEGLFERGHIRRLPNRARSIQIVSRAA